MCSSKSQTDIIVGLYKHLLTEDMVRQYGNAIEFRRDYAYLLRRVTNEGFSFLTKTLPGLAKAVDKALVSGTLTTLDAFKKAPKAQSPLFLRVLLERVFNSDGTVKTEPCISAVRDLRQICLLFYKYEAPYDKNIISQFIENFKCTDRSLGWEKPQFNSEISAVFDSARTLLDALFDGFDLSTIKPGHGPGAVATGEKNWNKMHFKRKYECIHREYPYYTYFYANAFDLASNVREYRELDSVPSGIAKTVLVPKDSRGPRLISEEPLEFMYIQQGQYKKTVEHLQSHPLTRGHVNFTDQSINGRLALEGSISGDIVTLDMKEASDRISLWLVKSLFENQPLLLRQLLATRTEATELPDGEIYLMRKFAPMGSANCFPIESVLHWCLAVSSLTVLGNVPLKRALKSVYVYGDDIIVKGENHVPLLEAFPHFMLKFNESKSCTSGIFRESCGTDAVLGQDVGVLKIKKPLPNRPYDANGYVSYLAYINRLWDDAYYSSSTYLGDFVKGLFGPIPQVPEDSEVPGFVLTRWPLIDAELFPKRWNKKTQQYERQLRSLVPKKHYRDNDRCEYQRKLLINSDEFVAGVYTVPRSVKLKKRWSSRFEKTEPRVLSDLP